MIENLNWNAYHLRSDQIAQWMQSEWIARRPQQACETLWTTSNILAESVLRKLDQTQTFDGWRFMEMEAIACPAVHETIRHGENGVIGQRTGAYIFRFENGGTNGARHNLEILGIVAQVSDTCWWELVALAAVPEAHIRTWAMFTRELDRLAYEYDNEVLVVGGNRATIRPQVNWDEVILPEKLKDAILYDVESFFDRGIDIYRRLNLNPFRKMLFAGVPGTGKTMMSMALAKWALARRYRVIYVSSARCRQGEESGATFDKVQDALDIAANSDRPALVILEELDAYLHNEEKALILNVLDGYESELNPHGTLLIATTNYPEAIDERVLKRPGRLDRVYIIPETQTADDAEAMLRRYLGFLWCDEHLALVPQLTGYPGAFIREVAIHALTDLATRENQSLTLADLERSFEGLRNQIETRDAFVTSRSSPAISEN